MGRDTARDGDTQAGGRSPTGWPGREVPGGRTRLSALCPLCSTWTWVLQEPQEMSPLSACCPSLAKLTRLKWAPEDTLGCTGVTSTMAPSPWMGWAWQVPCGLRVSLQPKLTLVEAEQPSPGRAQLPLYVSHTPGLGVFRGLGHGVGQGPG